LKHGLVVERLRAVGRVIWNAVTPPWNINNIIASTAARVLRVRFEESGLVQTTTLACPFPTWYALADRSSCIYDRYTLWLTRHLSHHKSFPKEERVGLGFLSHFLWLTIAEWTDRER
jgi:hypothetical protein